MFLDFNLFLRVAVLLGPLRLITGQTDEPFAKGNARGLPDQVDALELAKQFPTQLTAQSVQAAIDASVAEANELSKKQFPSVAARSPAALAGLFVGKHQRGSDFRPFLRLAGPNYADGISTPRVSATSPSVPLPSARLVSRTVVGYAVDPVGLTHMVMQFGQFLDHDLTSTAPQSLMTGLTPACCGVPPGSAHPSCFPIEIPPTDPYFSTVPQTCMEFVRSLGWPDAAGQRYQINQISSFIDGGVVYGSFSGGASNPFTLRAFTDGLLRVQVSGNYTLLPGEFSGGFGYGGAPSCIDANPTRQCLAAGDGRVNEQPGLASLHTVFHRQHNFVAGKLKSVNPSWNDEQLFQEARAIVIAQLQHITYNEWLPTVLGPAQINKQKLRLPNNCGRHTGYDYCTDPTVSNEFATAAFRVGHTMVQSFLSRPSSSSLRIRDTFFRSEFLYTPGTADRLVRGLITDSLKKPEDDVVVDLHDNLFFNGIGTPALDLVALNIQRGRDHGLPSYMEYRQFCNLSIVAGNDWTGLQRFLLPGAAAKMQQVYASTADIDLFVGGIAERPLNPGLLGPTFTCIIGEQFRRTRDGDRFFYANSFPATGVPSVIPDAQLQEICKTSFARILCDTIDITQIQTNVFKAAGPSNSLKACSTIPNLNWNAWLGPASPSSG